MQASPFASCWLHSSRPRDCAAWGNCRHMPYLARTRWTRPVLSTRCKDTAGCSPAWTVANYHSTMSAKGEDCGCMSSRQPGRMMWSLLVGELGLQSRNGGLVKLANTRDLKSLGGNSFRVQVPDPPLHPKRRCAITAQIIFARLCGDIEDLKSRVAQATCGFDSHPRH
jgi:hypothetical protein